MGVSGCLSGQGDPSGVLTFSSQFGAIRVRCLFTPCHTSGHMCYFMWEDGSPDAPALFSGTPACNVHPVGTRDTGGTACVPRSQGES